MNRALASASTSGAGWFGGYGGRFVPETLVPALEELAAEYDRSVRDAGFQGELRGLLGTYVGRPTPLHFARRLTERAGGAEIHLKREDLNHTGAHKINNALGQALLARRLGKKRVIAETGAGQHGVATATACALLGLECRVFMGACDMERQRPNVQRMRLLGADVVGVEAGSRTLKDAINAALREWVGTARDTHYLVGSVVGPDPFPRMVRDFQSVIGREAVAQCIELFGRPPETAIACVGGGSNAMGLFHPLLETSARLIGVEAAGEGLASGRHAATLARGSDGVLHGARTLLLQDADGQILEAHSVSAGLDYPGVGPEHAYLRQTGRARYVAVTDGEALEAFRLLARLEGIVPALESAHAVAYAMVEAGRQPRDSRIVVNLSGRGDKDLEHVSGLARNPGGAS